MKLNLDKNLLNLKGEPMQDKLSDVLANILAMSTTGKPAKMITWAVNLTNDDTKLIKKVIESDRFTINLAKAQLLEEIDNVSEHNGTDENCRFNSDDFQRDILRKVKALP
jgi:flavin reductase (DIM6/NTAB) family NADH-FMN oxidoreductase RutF